MTEKDGDNGEAEILAQHARAETQILQQGFDHREPLRSR